MLTIEQEKGLWGHQVYVAYYGDSAGFASHDPLVAAHITLCHVSRLVAAGEWCNEWLERERVPVSKSKPTKRYRSERRVE
jgi:hypothetical protein